MQHELINDQLKIISIHDRHDVCKRSYEPRYNKGSWWTL